MDCRCCQGIKLHEYESCHRTGYTIASADLVESPVYKSLSFCHVNLLGRIKSIDIAQCRAIVEFNVKDHEDVEVVVDTSGRQEDVLSSSRAGDMVFVQAHIGAGGVIFVHEQGEFKTISGMGQPDIINHPLASKQPAAPRPQNHSSISSPKQVIPQSFGRPIAKPTNPSNKISTNSVPAKPAAPAGFTAKRAQETTQASKPHNAHGVDVVKTGGIQSDSGQHVSPLVSGRRASSLMSGFTNQAIGHSHGSELDRNTEHKEALHNTPSLQADKISRANSGESIRYLLDQKVQTNKPSGRITQFGPDDIDNDIPW